MRPGCQVPLHALQTLQVPFQMPFQSGMSWTPRFARSSKDWNAFGIFQRSLAPNWDPYFSRLRVATQCLEPASREAWETLMCCLQRQRAKTPKQQVIQMGDSGTKLLVFPCSLVFFSILQKNSSILHEVILLRFSELHPFKHPFAQFSPWRAPNPQCHCILRSLESKWRWSKFRPSPEGFRITTCWAGSGSALDLGMDLDEPGMEPRLVGKIYRKP